MGNNNEDKLRALDAALGQIEKQYGKGAVMKLGDSAANMNVETILISRIGDTEAERKTAALFCQSPGQGPGIGPLRNHDSDRHLFHN